MTSHLISLADLHAAAPGILDVIFGADGDFPGAPEWRCAIWDSEDGPDGGWMSISRYAMHPLADQFDPLNTMFLDLRIPSIAAHLAGFCCRSADPRKDLNTWRRAADLAASASRGRWPAEYAPALAVLTISLAPLIAALKRTP